jgi:hypothetical protein
MRGEALLAAFILTRCWVSNVVAPHELPTGEIRKYEDDEPKGENGGSNWR